MLLRFDFEFSYWIFAWYLLYELKIINYNPKLAVYLAILISILIFLLMIYYSNPLLIIFLYFIINAFIKIIPLWRLKNTEYKINDLYFTICLFIIYLLWLQINNINFIKFNIDKYNKIKNKEISTPAIYYIINYFGNTRK